MLLYRAVLRDDFDPAKRYRRHTQPRIPLNVPYLVDNLWEALRPADRPSRRHAAYASPTPELALACAGRPGTPREAFVVCELVAARADLRVAQLPVRDARLHPDIAALPKAVASVLGEAGFTAPLAAKAPLALLFVPGLGAAEALALAAEVPLVARALAAAASVSRFWATARGDIDPGSDGEIFFELVDQATYRLRARD